MNAVLRAALLAGGVAVAGTANAAEPLKIFFITHAGATNIFFQAVKNGFEDACARIGAQCQMTFTQSDQGVAEQVANFEAAVATKPDVIITTIIDDTAMDQPVADAVDKGIIVLGANGDDSEGAKGNKRLNFIGANNYSTAYYGAQTMATFFPADGKISIALGDSAPGRPWSRDRIQGMEAFFKEWKEAHPDRDISWTTIASSTDPSQAADIAGAYLNANPDVNVYMTTGWFHVGVAQTLRDRGIPPGKILMSCFDLVPQCLDEMKKGYIQFAVDQQPYTQGFMSVMNAYLIKDFGLGALDMDTGKAAYFQKDVDSLMELSKKGVR